jgi:hypothetical protein
LSHIIDKRFHHDFRFTISETRSVLQISLVVDNQTRVAVLVQKHPGAVQKKVGALAYGLQLTALIIGLPKPVRSTVAQRSLARNLTTGIGKGLVFSLGEYFTTEQQTYENQRYNAKNSLHCLSKFGSKIDKLIGIQTAFFQFEKIASKLSTRQNIKIIFLNFK